MDQRKLQFLIAVVGDDGARALCKAAERAEELDQAIFPRAILAWLDVMAQFGHEGSVPGADDVKLSFKKSEAGFDGSIALNGELHRFEASSVAHVAGCIAVALGLDHERFSQHARPEQLAKLGKSIDLLVKSQLVKQALPKIEEEEIEKAVIKPNVQGQKRIQLPGTTAKPIGPIGPTAPTMQPKTQHNAPAGAAGTSQAIQLPKIQPKKPQVSVTKFEAKKKCRHCDRSQFSGDDFAGCYCFSSLAKSVTATPSSDGYTLTFGRGWDPDAILTLTENFKGK